METGLYPLVNPHRPVSKCLWFELEHIKWDKSERETVWKRKFTVYPPPASYFGIGRG